MESKVYEINGLVNQYIDIQKSVKTDSHDVIIQKKKKTIELKIQRMLNGCDDEELSSFIAFIAAEADDKPEMNIETLTKLRVVQGLLSKQKVSNDVMKTIGLYNDFCDLYYKKLSTNGKKPKVLSKEELRAGYGLKDFFKTPRGEQVAIIKSLLKGIQEADYKIKDEEITDSFKQKLFASRENKKNMLMRIVETCDDQYELMADVVKGYVQDGDRTVEGASQLNYLYFSIRTTPVDMRISKFCDIIDGITQYREGVKEQNNSERS